MGSKVEFILKSGFDQMDFDKVTAMLTGAWWSKGITKSEVIQGAVNSAFLAGAFTPDNKQIGYSRVISDKTRFAYILDVIVDEQYRKQGIGHSMIKFIMAHPALTDVYQWLLVTKDAHGVYQKVGFNPISRPSNWMEIRYKRPDR